MVNLYVWDPPALSEVLDRRILPDFGHAAIEVVNDEGQPLIYASFWPEIESLVGQALQPFKPREVRNPISYEAESDPDGGYMQRHADYLEPLEGLEESRILRDWAELQDARYDLTSWNCSNVCKLLILRAMSPDRAGVLGEKLAVVVEDLQQLQTQMEMFHAMRHLATSSFIDCRPEDVLCLVRTYNDLLVVNTEEEKVEPEFAFASPPE